MAPDILFYGDPHGLFDPLIEAVARHRPRAVILLGDMELREQSLDTVLAPLREAVAAGATMPEIYWIPGNHESDTDAAWAHVFGSSYVAGNLHARVAEVAGRPVAGLGGVFRGRVWYPRGPRCKAPVFFTRNEHVAQLPERDRWQGAGDREPGLPRRHRTSIYPEDIERLRGLKADILVTHEAPSPHASGFDTIDGLAELLGAVLIVHGHHHQDYEAHTPDGVRVRGVGRAGVVGLYPDGRLETLTPGTGGPDASGQEPAASG